MNKDEKRQLRQLPVFIGGIHLLNRLLMHMRPGVLCEWRDFSTFVLLSRVFMLPLHTYFIN